MANMSYCRFENTLSDLKDCEGALEAFAFGDEDPADLSEYEMSAARRLLVLCARIAEKYADVFEGP